MISLGCCIDDEAPEPIEFKVDRPFMFVIQERRRGLTLFQGKYLSSKT
jgi:serine protease inhibitor